ncbi:hypothetical protein PEL8287_03486 [Roseovarius litorisediminis]|uniref:Sulfotransferase family protein n=1 Tax=Roseovarius litorisediminis TaxID=1312363 RepID=A0A1Y5TJY5_9RHOB|nr:hypothetical protein [Roseovarius litorisediminis]SLN63712.1 hypothetical protein PEL8287_03486 [Roseovarius litorisediminis]
MQIFFKQNLAILAVPKTGTTAYAMALRSEADIIFTKRRKHMTAGQFHNKTAPFLERLYRLKPERLAVMREPIDQIRSWYRYRSQLRLEGRPASTAGCSFDDFVLAVISDSPPEFAKIGSQYRFLIQRDGSLAVHHLFAYEKQPLLRKFLEDRFEKPLTVNTRNASPPVDAQLSPEVESRLRKARPDEFRLYNQLMDKGGYLFQESV